jgi:hypothetical protein
MSWLLSIAYWIPTIVAVVDYFRRRPDWYWLFIIFFFGPLGAVVYLVVVVLPKSGFEESVAMSLGDRRRKRELEHRVKTDPLPGHLAELGELNYKDGKYVLAIERLTKAIESGIDHEDARYFLGRSYEKEGDYENAIEHLVKVVRKDPRYKFGEAMMALGRSCEATGRKADAVAAYRRILENNTYAQARYRLALLIIEDGKLDEVRTLMRKIVDESFDQPGFAKRKEGQYVSKAKAWLRANPSA